MLKREETHCKINLVGTKGFFPIYTYLFFDEKMGKSTGDEFLHSLTWINADVLMLNIFKQSYFLISFLRVII